MAVRRNSRGRIYVALHLLLLNLREAWSDNESRNRWLIRAFWIVFIAIPLAGPILTNDRLPFAYHWLQNESFDEVRHEALYTREVAENSVRVEYWKVKATGEEFTRADFQEHRRSEGYRIFTIDFLYGLIGCLFYAASRTWPTFNGFSVPMLKAVLVNLTIAAHAIWFAFG